MKLSWDDLHKLSVLVAKKVNDTSLSAKERRNWGYREVRLFDGAPQTGDLRLAAELAELEAARQQDPKLRQRYLDLARRSHAEAL